jgi:Na+-transporting NADH:ubiquinone oxidoreductase subunit NqrB
MIPFMHVMITLSLLLNIVVLLPVCAGLIRDAGWTKAAFGGATPARGILLSIYLSIMSASALLLISRDPKLVSVLLWMQIVYKLTTPITVGTVKNPVVISNIGIAAFHIVTTLLIWQAIGNPLIARSH